MKRLLLGIVTLSLLIGVAALSGNPKSALPEIQLQVEGRNPWTHLRLNNDPADFQFVIVSDRTGGHRAGVFSRAVEQINMLQPQFVLSVGDLIEGYSKDEARINAEWKEFQSYVGKLQMPFFYVAGNHDVANPIQEQIWKDKFGRRYYHFVYRQVLFLCLDTDDPPGKEGGISDKQVAYVKEALGQNKDVRWTIVALHRPVWGGNEGSQAGWLKVESMLTDRPYTVFAGHVHRYQKFVRQGRNYYQLATTGGGSKMRGIERGEFDHITWVTMKREGPVLANIMLDGIYPEDMRKPVSEEPGVPTTNRKPTVAVKGRIHFEGSPVTGAQVVFHQPVVSTDKDKDKEKKFTRTGDAFVEPDGTFSLSSYTANDGAPVGDYHVTVIWRKPWVDEHGKPGPNLLPEKYAKPDTTDLRATVKSAENNFNFDLAR